jgi:hypothetical protein
VRAIVIATASILGHDLLDDLQATDWASSFRIVQNGPFGLSGRVASEAIVSALLFAAFLAWRAANGRSPGRLPAMTLASSKVVRWMPTAIVTAILIAAVGTYLLRGRHERQLNDARRLIDSGDYTAALRMADKADAWPRGNRPGRVEMIQAEAHARLGHAETADALFLTAYQKDPTNFWALADLAEHYAASDRPERRRLARLRADELKQRFPRHPRLHDVLEGIERELSRTDTTE